MSFASLVYASAWIKRYYPAAFCAALLNAQPMGFYSPQSLVADARRHGVQVRSPDINASLATATLEPAGPAGAPPRSPHAPDTVDRAIRLGLAKVRTIGDDLAERIVAERSARGRYASMADLTQRVALSAAQTEALATAGAFGCFELGRRQALWAAGAVAQAHPGGLAGVVVGADAPALPELNGVEEAMADVWSTGISPSSYPTEFARCRLAERGAVPIASLAEVLPGSRIFTGGVVTHRQRPATAGGVTFLNLEDETGMVNVVCSPGFWSRYRRVLRASAALLIRGRLERAEGVVNVVAEHAERLSLSVHTTSRNFR
jgi:error-prone DNA polymerase